jgi:hypothetical protein
MDTNAVLRAASVGNLTADATLDDFDLTPMWKPLYLHILIPSVTSGDVLDVTADFENISGTTLQQTTIPQITAAGKYVIPIFCDHPDLTDLSVILNVTLDSTVAGSFGAVEVWLSPSRKS